MSAGYIGTVMALVVLAGCQPARAPGPPKAVLVGVNQSRSKGDQRSGLRGKIVAIDGRATSTAPGKEMELEPGCHIVEVTVNYEITRPTDDPCPWDPLIGAFGACNESTRHSSGLRHFAIPMDPGKRYELSVLINADAVWVSFVEVDAELGTVARFLPVSSGTRVCAPGIPVGSVTGPLRQALGSKGRAF